MALCSTAQFRRSGQRDDRRRRLLSDEALGIRRIDGPATQSLESHPDSPAYPKDVLMTHQVRLLDLIPRRPLALAAVLAAGLLAAGGLVWLDLWAARQAAQAGLKLDALRLGSPHSLGRWLGQTALLAAALASLVVYTVRRHRKDDYQGRYRVWGWAAACWVLLALDVASGLHHTLRELMIHFTGTPLVGDGSIWWLAPGGLLLATVGSRLLVDMLPDRWGSASLLGAALLGLVSLALHWQALPLGDPRLAAVLPGAGAMLAAVLLFWAMLAHGRYVILEAEGLIVRRQAEPAQSAQAASASTGGPRRSDGAHETLAGCHQKSSSRIGATLAGMLGLARTPESTSEETTTEAGAAASADQIESQPVGSSPRRKLTKAEKKALRKRLIEMRLKRQQAQQAAWKS